MQTQPILLAAAMVALAMTSLAALAAPSVVVDQELVDQVFDPGADFENPIDLSVDAADVQTDPSGLNTESGVSNLQENQAVIGPPDDAASDLSQSLINNAFNTETAETNNSSVRNTIGLDITASDEIVAAVGINTAAGAFNLQANASVIAPVTGDTLAQSAAVAQQDSQLNDTVVGDVFNDVQSSITLDTTAANVGINTVAGTGNEQLNTATILTNY